MESLADKLDAATSLNRVTIPDLWQQEAVTALRDGLDVVVQAPTGSGKTLIFELWSNRGRNRGQAIYTVPTRALANDKLAEWRARGWNVGIATGDLAENLDAPVIVATLETQKNRLIRGDGPALLVVDEYQMLGDPDRGLNYELALALAPERTQLLLLSGSVSNPHHIVKWLERLGRRARLIRHEVRPVPLEEVYADHLNFNLPREIRGYWPRFCAKALAENLGPILLFAPRRRATETIAAEIARQLPNPHPLELTDEQNHLVGERLAKLLKARVAYHHSGLSYAVRAGVIEPLAKAGQLRVVVATMGLAAGINFSMRSVAMAADSYRRDQVEQPIRPDAILQMMGRAGRRGIDEVGYFLVSANGVRMREGYACHLSRSGMVDWGALLGVMHGAVEQGERPFHAAIRVQERLFTTRPIHLGVELSLKHPNMPCGLNTDAERARHVRSKEREFVNSRGEWEPHPGKRSVRAGDVFLSPKRRRPRQTDGGAGNDLIPLLCNAQAVDSLGQGSLAIVDEAGGRPVYGRSATIGETAADGDILIAKWVRRLIGWKGRHVSTERWHAKVTPQILAALEKQNRPVLRIEEHKGKLLAIISLAGSEVPAVVDQYGVALHEPEERHVDPRDCAVCELRPVCRELPTAAGVAYLWKKLGLTDDAGVPTRRGRIVSFLSSTFGLALAAALDDETYPVDEIVYDVVNLDAGFRFCREEDRYAGRMAMVCRDAYGHENIPGYLEAGVPPKYGSGAEEVVRGLHKNPMSKHAWTSEWLGDGDIDRVVIEWRSVLRQIAHAPALDWPRWTALQTLARSILNETTSPTETNLPTLPYHQQHRIEHKLVLRRH